MLPAGLWFAVVALTVAAGAVLWAWRRVRAAEAEARDSEARYRTLADSLPFSVWQVSADGSQQYSNTYVRNYTGLEAEQHADADWATAIHPDEGPGLAQRWQQGLASGAPFQLDHRLRRAEDGQYRWFRTLASPVRDAAGRLTRWVGASVDIHDQHLADEALREREQALQVVIDNSPALISYIDADGRYRLVNRQYERWFGRPREQILGQSMADVLGGEAMQALQPHVDRVLRQGETVRFEKLAPYRDGGARWIDAQYVPDHDREGTVRGFFVFVLDISERKAAEAALQEADRRKDEFLATLAHELRNPLAPISNAVQILKLKLTDPELEWSRAVIERQVAQMARLLDDLLDVNRIGRGKVELRRAVVTLASVIENALETVRPLIDAAGHALAVELPPEPIRIDGDPVRLAQIFANLLNNAAKYTPEQGRLRLRATRTGAEVTVEVTDSGIGIEPAMLPHVFDMFSQAEPARERSRGGLGVGLSLVRGLVELHGGRVEARSDGAGHGSTFVVHLPCQADAAAVAEPAQRTA